MQGRDFIDALRGTVDFNDYEMHRFVKTGNIRWESVFHFTQLIV